MNASGFVHVECPRDSWQGLRRFVPTGQKIEYLRALLEAGFGHLDLGSFVSAKAVPQMQDTETVLAALPPPAGRDYLCIVGNERGLERALGSAHCTSVAYPLSISAGFARRNLNQSLAESWKMVQGLQQNAGRLRFVVHVSMGFGNPYGDPWNLGLVLETVARLRDLGVGPIALADTHGQADARRVLGVCTQMVQRFGAHNLGAHLHARPENVRALAQAVVNSGLSWIEGALGGVGGCPFAGDELVGNLATEAYWPLLPNHSVVSQETLAGLAAQALRIKLEYA